MKSVDRLQQYLRGDLSEAELDEQTRELARAYFADADRKKKWGELLEDQPDWQAFRASLPPTDSTPAKPSQSSRWLWPAIAAGLLLLAALVYWLTRDPDTISRPQFVAEQLAQPHPYQNSRAVQANDADLRQRAAEDYQNADYAAAIVPWQKLYDAGDATTEDRFYLAQAHLYQKNYAAAIALYEEILALESRLYQREARWYLALAQLRVGQEAPARQQLEALSQQRGWKSTEADQLLQTWLE